MRIAAPAKDRARAVGLVVSPSQVFTSWGVRALDECDKLRLFSYDSTGLLDHIRRIGGSALYWNGRVTGYVIGRHRIRVLGDVFDTDPRGAFEALDEWAGWVHALGSAPGSFAGASIGIYKACANRTTFLASERHATVPRDGLLIGARQEANPGIYHDLDAWDVPAAYPSTLGRLWVPKRYRRFRAPKVALNLIGFGRAEVVVPEVDYGPLPAALSRYVGVMFPTDVTLEGVWDLSELELAQRVGCRVKMVEAWVGVGLSPSFRAWRAAVATGSELRHPDARSLAKATAVALWGFFAAQGTMTKVTYTPDGGEAFNQTKPRQALAFPIAAHVAAAMRVRLYDEALTRAPVVAHTDGAIMRAEPGGNGWRHEGRLARVEVASAQNYRYVTDEGEVGYCLAGVPRTNAPAVWELRYKELLAHLGILEKGRRGYRLRDFQEPAPTDDDVSPGVLVARARAAAFDPQTSFTL